MPAWKTISRSLKVLVAGGILAITGCGGGADGAPGAPGTRGDPGPAGADGTNGVDGTNGTNGTNGADGTPGTNGVDGTNGTDGKDYVSSKLCKNIDLKITSVSNSGGSLAITFTVSDNGNPITNLTMAPIRFMCNQYKGQATPQDNGIWSVDKFYERDTTPGADSRLVQDPNAAGTYTYTFLETIQEGVTNDGVDTALPSQCVMRIRGLATGCPLPANQTYNSVNDVYQMDNLAMADGVAATPVATPINQIVTTAGCETCHGPRLGNVGHGGGYNRVEYCTNCHTQDDATFVTDGLDFRTMIHQIHGAIDHTNGGVATGFDWSAVTFPQDVRNCNKCHTGVAGQNWNTLGTKEACGSCHTATNFATGAGHAGGKQLTNANCGLCHDADTVKSYHVTDISTPNNPDVPVGAANFEYKVNSVTVGAGGVPTVNFQILKDGAPITNLHTVYPPTGFTGGPSFLVAYALPQDGVLMPADWNNKGTVQGQPISVSLATVAATATLNAADNTYNVALPTAPFPAGSTMRAVAMNAYFTQTMPAPAAALPRHTASVYAMVTGDVPRRAAINLSGCLDCHEVLELHGGSRTITDKTDTTMAPMCTLCHNPNLSSSGNTFNIGAYVAGSSVDSDATIAKYGNNPLLWPEDSQNFKDLVHGIHSSGLRENPYEHVRIRSGVAYSFDWSEVTFPGDPSNCDKCHQDKSYMIESVPMEALWSTKVTTNGAIVDMASAVASRASVPNPTDMVLDPVVSACNSCHAGKLVNAHMDQNGGNLGLKRSDMANASPATCSICHSSGNLADISLRHPGLNP